VDLVDHDEAFARRFLRARKPNQTPLKVIMQHGAEILELSAKNLEIAYCLIGEHVVRGWTFKQLELGS
jgi:hypothetical protein